MLESFHGTVETHSLRTDPFASPRGCSILNLCGRFFLDILLRRGLLSYPRGCCVHFCTFIDTLDKLLRDKVLIFCERDAMASEEVVFLDLGVLLAYVTLPLRGLN